MSPGYIFPRLEGFGIQGVAFSPQTRSMATSLINHAVVLHGKDDLRYEEWPLSDEIGPGQVRIQIKAVGICGSDVHFWKHGRIAHFVVEAPMVIGHESAGQVVGVGPGVTALHVGDRVALEPGIPCWEHRLSRSGSYNLDPDIKFFATPPHHGSLCNFIDHPAYLCYKLPDNLDYEDGAMCEPLSVGIHACRRSGVSPGKRVLILGAGPIGLVALLSASAFGADCVAITDLRQEALDLARELGARVTQRTLHDETPEEAARKLKESAAPDGFDIVIDCAGFESTMQTALAAAAPGAKVVLVGMGQVEMKLPLGSASIREVDILGSFRYKNTYDTCLSLLSSGRINVKPLITHRHDYTEKEVLQGFETASKPAETGAIKVMFSL
uniref:Enoyl reductase (ER) domain-containing protein n=1 Tax=Auxenochlorella protothecoides TaxID=3075 RepID=A0A1D2A890_AUXPR